MAVKAQGSTFEEQMMKYTTAQIKSAAHDYKIDNHLFEEHHVQRGLRDKQGNGVITGLTNISLITSKEIIDGKAYPAEGHLYYRGYTIEDLVGNIKDSSTFRFEETAYLLLFGELPTEEQLDRFKVTLADNRRLPTNFVRDIIMKAPSRDIMNSITRSVLTLASYDDDALDVSPENVLRQCLMLISVMPRLAVYAYHSYNHYVNDESMYIHKPDPDLSLAENILRLLRPGKDYTELEAKVLDATLILHMEHGGGNNSTFTTRVVTSAGSDTYSVMAAALSSLKGPKHGGANLKVIQMMKDIKKNVEDITDEDQLRDYLTRMLDGEVFDKTGLIYGMGHAVYSLSDPRAMVLKTFAESLAKEKGREDDYQFYDRVAELAAEIIAEKRKIYKGVCVNVDFYSGFVYQMLDLPLELYTPMFAIARTTGWSAHRLEQIINEGKIIRPAYESIVVPREYVKIDKR